MTRKVFFNDGYIDVSNVNLSDSRDVIKSKIYSPERQMASYLGNPTNVYKLWEKEVSQDAQGEDLLKFKQLDKRYYLMRAVPRSSPITVVSKQLNLSQPANDYFIESFHKLSFPDIIQAYYQPLKRILDKTTIVNVEMYLKPSDISNFDFKKLYYIEQLGNYFIMNKINNFTPGRSTKCELVRVIYAPEEQAVNHIKIIRVDVAEFSLVVKYELYLSINNFTFQYSQNLSTWSSVLIQVTANNHFGYQITTPGAWYIRIKSGESYSNIVQITIPDNTTVIIN